MSIARDLPVREVSMSNPSFLLGLTGLNLGGGIAVVARSVNRALGEEVAAGRASLVDRVLLHDSVEGGSPPSPGGECHLARGSHARMVWQLWRCHRRRRHDWVFFDQLGLARAAQLPLPGFPPSRYAIFCHGIELDRVRPSGSRRASLLGARRLLCNSDHTAAVVGARFPEVADRVRVVSLCIDQERARAWERLPPPPRAANREPVVMIVGRMWSEEPGKGHDALIAAMTEVRRTHPEAQLWVVGDGDARAHLEAKARRVAPPGSVIFLGRLSDAELTDRYRRAAVFAMPSRQEGFGLVYAEAMWHGLPCVGSTADAAGNVIEDGATGLLVPYGNAQELAKAVSRLLGASQLRDHMGERAARRARERFGFARFKEDLLHGLE